MRVNENVGNVCESSRRVWKRKWKILTVKLAVFRSRKKKNPHSSPHFPLLRSNNPTIIILFFGGKSMEEQYAHMQKDWLVSKNRHCVYQDVEKKKNPNFYRFCWELDRSRVNGKTSAMSMRKPTYRRKKLIETFSRVVVNRRHSTGFFLSKVEY